MTWKDDALIHAKEQDPKESCGLLLNIRGKEKYFPCQNLSITSHQCFIMNPEDYVVADSIGEIIGIVHSHPTTPPVASEADKISCEESKLPWYIVNPKIETWGYYEPCGYKAPLLGRPWVWGVTDCLSLVEDWYLEEKQISFKKATRPLTPEIFAENPQSKEDGDFDNYLTTAGFRLLAPNEKLQNGDVLAMSILGKGLNHVGIFIDGDVLHHLGDRLSCKEPYNPWLLKCTGGRYRYASQN
ncbi:MAG: peptidase P60 [Bacteroidetes bacterium]|jgi:proteasome lid subunit RPN8/RPN11|nr:MAG: peptidase P60 [Bacteroidota bacterium]